MIFTVYLNALHFQEVDEPWASQLGTVPTLESAVRFACTPGVAADLDSLLARYREISTESTRLHAAPTEPTILNKMVWPLRHAKASFMFGNYLGTISLCGLVAEMAAVLSWKISEVTVNGQPMAPAAESALFGRTFEHLGQERRVAVLDAYGLISSNAKSHFNALRGIRNQYLHFLSQDHADVAGDAVKAFNAATSIVSEIIGQQIAEDGSLRLNPKVVRFLERAGLVELTPAVGDAEPMG